MLPNDLFCRAAVFPRCISQTDCVDASALLQFSGAKLAVRSLSLASYFLCRTDDGVHNFGEKIAEAGNLRAIRGGVELTEEKKQIYLGFYSFKFCNFDEIKVPHLSMRLFWRMENGDDRHFQVDCSPLIGSIQEAVANSIALETEEAQRSGKKQKPANATSRAERIFDAQIRTLRENIYSILVGPSIVDARDDGRRAELQKKYLPNLPVSVH